MPSSSDATPGAAVTRRAVLKSLAAIALAGAGSACTPVRMALRIAPGGFDADPDLVDRVLRGFVTAVIPGMPADDQNLVRFFYDESYPLAKYRGYIASDLCQTSLKCFGTHEFDRLSVEQRSEIIEQRLAVGGLTNRLYRGAVFLTQISCYAGIYDAERGCSLIDFPGRHRVAALSQSTYPNPERFLAREISVDGNPA